MSVYDPQKSVDDYIGLIQNRLSRVQALVVELAECAQVSKEYTEDLATITTFNVSLLMSAQECRSSQPSSRPKHCG